MAEFYQTGQGRVFLQRYGSGPGNPVTYLGCARVGGFTEPLGDVTPIYCPDERAYDAFEIVGEIQGEAGMPTTSIVAKFGGDNSLLTIRCPFDLHVHYGTCKKPSDFDEGWDLALIFERARITSRSSDDLTAFAPDGRAEILITAEVTARRIVTAKPLTLGEKAKAEVLREAADVALEPSASCGACGPASTGCDAAYIAVKGSGLSSPGLPPELVYTRDGGASWQEQDIDTLASDEDPSAVDVVGDLVVVVSHDSGSLHYADRDDLGAWKEVTTGFLTGGEPNDLYSAGPRHTWIVGDGGTIYFTDDVTSGVTVQDAGNATSQNLLRIHGLDDQFLVAVGANNAVVFTENGGTTWVPVTGPEPLATLQALWVRTRYCWLVGTSAGRLYYTVDQGQTWAERPFPGSGAGSVTDIAFSHQEGAVGYLAHTDGTKGRILRSTNGGASWRLLPEVRGAAMPANDRVNRLAACEHNADFVLGVGLGDDGVDGFVVLGVS